MDQGKPRLLFRGGGEGGRDASKTRRSVPRVMQPRYCVRACQAALPAACARRPNKTLRLPLPPEVTLLFGSTRFTRKTLQMISVKKCTLLNIQQPPKNCREEKIKTPSPVIFQLRTIHCHVMMIIKSVSALRHSKAAAMCERYPSSCSDINQSDTSLATTPRLESIY